VTVEYYAPGGFCFGSNGGGELARFSNYRSAESSTTNIDDLAFIHPIVPKVAELTVDTLGERAESASNAGGPSESDSILDVFEAQRGGEHDVLFVIVSCHATCISDYLRARAC
jgi:hypothetical protein